MNAVGILGGSFDPVHIGHLLTAQAILEERNLSKIIFIPCHISPHKVEKGNSLPHHRLEMLKLALADYPLFQISEIELEREGVSFTIDTLRILKKEYDKIELIIGYDNILKFSTWKEPDAIMEIAKVLVMKRNLTEDNITKDKYYNGACFVNTPVIEISSSLIRSRAQNNLPIDFYTPEKVKNYILKNKLYKKD
jgi:nicotinate-nucleotide adenylyltransferase